MTIGQSAPIDPMLRFAEQSRQVIARVAELERAANLAGIADKVNRSGDTMTGALRIETASGDSLYLAGTGASEGGQLILEGAGAYQDWNVDNYNGTMRIHSEGQVPLHFGTNEEIYTNKIIHASAALYVPDNGHWQLRNEAGTNLLLIDSNDGTNYNHLLSAGANYFDGTTHIFRSAAGYDWVHIDAVGGVGGIYFTQGSGGWYMEDTTWLRSYANKGVYTSGEIRAGIFTTEGVGYILTDATDTDTGLYYGGSGSIQLVSNGVVPFYCEGGISSINDRQLRIRTATDTNHYLQYTTATPTGSGEAANGPILAGYSSVWLYNVSANKSAYLASSGHFFLSSGASYLNFSSREFKQNIRPLDPEDSLAIVNRWRPVEFDFRDDDKGNAPAHRHGEGFIAEDHVAVSPSMVNVEGPDSARPGWANAIDYSNGVVRLTGAVQALLARVETLERRIAVLEAAQSPSRETPTPPITP